MILHSQAGKDVVINASEIKDIRSSRPGAGCVVILRHEFLPVKESISQVRRNIQREKETLQPRLSL